MAQGHSSWVSQHALVAFFVLTYVLTGLLSAIGNAGSLGLALPAGIQNLGMLLLHWGPALAAALLTAWLEGGAGLRRLLGRLLLWRVAGRWYAIALLFPLALGLATAGQGLLLYRVQPVFFSFDLASGLVPNGNPLLLLVPVFVGVFLQAGLAEEIGWRGFALPRLQGRYSALASSLVLGLLWTAWHFLQPQFFALWWPVAGWYVLSVVCTTILLTWLYNHTGGSLLLAALFHTASNTTDWIVPIAPMVAGAVNPVYLIQRMLALLFVAGLVVVFGPRRLVREPSPASHGTVRPAH